MRFSDLFNPKTGPEAIVRLAVYPFLILIIGSLASTIVGRLNGTDSLLLMLFFILMSPVAYVLRERRQGHRQEPRTRRGAERTPLLPNEEEGEEE